MPLGFKGGQSSSLDSSSSKSGGREEWWTPQRAFLGDSTTPDSRFGRDDLASPITDLEGWSMNHF